MAAAIRNKKSQEKQAKIATSAQLVTFWGVRGTLPTPGPTTLKYGGNTSCVEIAEQKGIAKCSLVFDAGSGIASYGDHALARGQREFHIFLSHMHYDHVIGLTKFAPIFRSDCKVTFYGQAKCGQGLKTIIASLFSYPYFPVQYIDLKSSIHFVELNQLEDVLINHTRIQFQPLNHPQESLAFRVWSDDGQTSVVYATDHEHGTKTDASLTQFSKNTDLFIFDSTYTEVTYQKAKGFGHSTAKQGARLAKEAAVGAYAIFHHDPSSSDDYLEKNVLREAQEVFSRSFLSCEGQTLYVQQLQYTDLKNLNSKSGPKKVI